MAIKLYQVSFEHSLSFAEAASTMAAYGSKEWHTNKTHKKRKCTWDHYDFLLQFCQAPKSSFV